MKHFFSQLGLQRIALAILSIFFIMLCFFADTGLPHYGWYIILSIVVPAAPPLLFMVHALDLLMSRVWRHEFGDEGVRRYDRIALFDLCMICLLTAVWLPIFLT